MSSAPAYISTILSLLSDFRNFPKKRLEKRRRKRHGITTPVHRTPNFEKLPTKPTRANTTAGADVKVTAARKRDVETQAGSINSLSDLDVESLSEINLIRIDTKVDTTVNSKSFTSQNPIDEPLLESFPLFQELPEDLRLLIWEIITWTAPRVFRVRILPPDEVRIRCNFPTPALLVCWESRNEALRCYKMLNTGAENPHKQIFDLPSSTRILTRAGLRPCFNSDRDSIALTLSDFVPFPDVHDKRLLFEKLILDNNVCYLRIDNVFVTSLDGGSRPDPLEDLFPVYLLMAALKGVRIGFFLPCSGSDEKVKNESTTRIYLDRPWIPASGEGLKKLLKVVKHFVTLYFKEKNRTHVPTVESIR